MKSVTEFFTFKLVKGIDAKAALVTEGKTPEEIEQSLSEAFKFEGDKLKHFVNSMEVASSNMENLMGIQVVSLNEGETIPEKAVKIEEHYYVPEFKSTKPAPAKAAVKSKDGGKGGKKNKGPKPSPWGLTPEEKAAKKGKSLNSQASAGKKDS